MDERCWVPPNDKSGCVLTHLLLDNGRYHVEEGKMDRFQNLLAQAIRDDNVLCITENHTTVFPMYVDVDLKVPAPALDDDAVARMARVMNAQVQRFFEDRHEPFKCVVCTKKEGVAATATEDGRFKHGVHLHWPDLLVTIDRALELRASMVAGLEREDWSVDLCTSEVAWDEVVDEGVYSGGLRMVGAPKARKCPKCKAVRNTPCDVCCGNNNGHVIDAQSKYGLRMVLLGGVVDADARASLAANLVRLVKATSVRAPKTAEETPGYQRYVGAPVVSRKRKAAAVEAKYRRRPEVTDPAVMRILQKQVARHSPLYANARLRVFTDGVTYKVSLSGEGGTYCLNKEGDHTSQNVWMEVCKHRGEHASRMRCYCRCPVQRVSGLACKDFASRPKLLDLNDAARLFRQEGGGGKSGKSRA